MKNLHQYGFLQDRLAKKLLKCHAIWLDIFTSEVYMFSYIEKRFIKLDENSYEQLYQEAKIENTDEIKA
jgi:hypothetical protein